MHLYQSGAWKKKKMTTILFLWNTKWLKAIKISVQLGETSYGLSSYKAYCMSSDKESLYKEKKVPDSKDCPKNVYTQTLVNQKAPKYTLPVQLNPTTGSVSGLKVTFIVI